MARHEQLTVGELLDGDGNKVLGSQAATIAAVAGTAPAGGTGDAAGAYDTAENRDLAIATINENKAKLNLVIAALKAHGIIASS